MSDKQQAGAETPHDSGLDAKELKQITADVDAWLKTLPNEQQQSSDADELTALDAQLRQVKKQLKSAKKDKSQTSRLFKDASAEQKLELKAQMQVHSAAVKQKEEQLSQLTGAISLLASKLLEKHKESAGSVEKKPPYMVKRYPNPEVKEALDITVIEFAGADLPIDDATNQTAASNLSKADWHNYVAEHPSGNFYHELELCQMVSKLFNQQFYGFVALNKDCEICGILPLIRLSSRLFGDFAVSVPYFNYGGALGDNAEIEKQLMQHASAVLLKDGAGHIEFRDTFDREWLPGRSDKASMVLSLEPSIEEQFAAFSPKLRAQIRRPERENVSCKNGGLELLDDFYAVFAENMRDLGTPVYDKSLFSNLLKQFPNNCRLQLVYLNNRPVSCGFLLHYKNVVEIPWASTLQSVNHLSINMLLYWQVLQFAIQSGADWFDFGRSSVDAGTYKFKRQWGAEPIMHRWHFALPEGEELPQLNPNNPKFKLMIAVWQRLPIWLTKLIGPPVVKNIP